MKLWKQLANKGLLTRYSTDQTTYQDIAATGLALTRLWGHPGLTMTWLGQLLKLGFLKRQFKPPKQCINAILSGDVLCSLAISEPGTGAHPKHLSCTAKSQGDNYVLNGEKAYVSHGPYADWFIVLAITDTVADRKLFSAFLIHKTQSGLTLGPAEQSTRLAPSSHCSITFDQCQIPKQALIGTPGSAFEEISKPMRTLEDVLMLAPIAGAMQVQLELLVNCGKNGLNLDVANEKAPAIDADLLGHCFCLTESVAELGLLSAHKLDQSAEPPDLTSLIIGARALISDVQAKLEPLLHFHPRLETLFNDIQLLSTIAQGATQVRVKSIAENYLAGRH